MNKLTENQPNASKLMESLRSSGYDNYSAIADLIDNSFDANADMIKFEIGEGKDGTHVITLSDNGDGMDANTLDQALKLGSITKQDDDTLGKYGLGLITASISIGRRLVVITKNSGKYLTGIHDLDEIVKHNSFVKEIRPSTEAEINNFMSHLGTALSGTVIYIQNIDNLQNKNNTSFCNTLTKHCGEVFRDFLEANKTLTINRKVVRSIDPMMRKDSGTVELLDKSREFTTPDGKKSVMRIRVYHLPNFTRQESRERKVNTTHQGFYLMRNNRQVAGGQTLGIFTRHNDINRFRAEVYFDGTMDRMVGINFKKQNIALFDEVRAWIELVAYPQIDSVVTAAKRSQQNNRENKTQIDHTPTQRIVTSRKTVLKKPKLDEETDPSLKDLHSDNFTNVQFKEQQNTHLAPLFQIGIEGDKLVINYNADHIFYQTVFQGAEENKELVNAIDSLVYSASLALIGITSSEKNLPLKDQFLDNLSDNLRSLLS